MDRLQTLAALGLDPDAEAVYAALVDHPAMGVAALAESLGRVQSDVRAALDTLFRLSLLRRSIDSPGHLHPVDLRAALQIRLTQQQDELAARQQEVARSQEVIATALKAYARLPLEYGAARSERLVGLDAIHDRLQQLACEAQTEVLSLMPGGAQSSQALEAGQRNDSILLDRGVAIRTVLQDSARHDQATLAYARWLADSGGETRTTAVLPTRMLIIDGRVALLPLDPGNTRTGAVQVSEQGILVAVRALFDQIWDMAVPLGIDRSRDGHGLTNPERELLKLLAQGMTDEAAARKLGVSERTSRRMMAALMERLGARSRFEAGLLAAQHGWI